MILPSLIRTLFRPVMSPVFLACLVIGMMVLSPLADQVAPAQPTEQPATIEEPTGDDGAPDDAATEEPATDADSEDPALLATEAAAAGPETHTLTISVYRCDHPTFDPYFSSNMQMVLTQCTGPGVGDFSVTTDMEVPPASGNQVQFQIGTYLIVEESVRLGFDSPIANCFVYDANGTVVDQIGPGEANGGFWKLGSVGADVHCDWYQVDRGLGMVYVVNMACPSTAGFFPAPSMDQLVSICTEPAGSKQFFVDHNGGLSRMGVSGGEFNDVLFEAIPTGPIAIRMDSPTGFDLARVFCQVTTLEGAELSPFAEVGVADFRTTGLTLVAGQRFHCSWFNIQEGPGLSQTDTGETISTVSPASNPSTLTVALYTCPVGYDPAAETAEPQTECAAGPNGVNFTLTDADPATVDLQTMTGDSIPFAVTYGGIPAGDVTVIQTIPAGIDQVFVLGCGGGGGIDPIPQFLTNGTTTIGLPPGVLMTCRWFNIPGATATGDVPDEATPVDGVIQDEEVADQDQGIAQAATPVDEVIPGEQVAAEDEGIVQEATSEEDITSEGGVADEDQGTAEEVTSEQTAAASTGTSSIRVHAYSCPAGTDPSTLTSNPNGSCDPIEGIPFDITGTVDDHAGYSIETGVQPLGEATIRGLPADTYTLSTGAGNGATVNFAWDCYDAAGASDRTTPLALGSDFELDLAAGAQIRCDWFTVADGASRVSFPQASRELLARSGWIRQPRHG